MAKKRKDSTPQSGTLFDFFKTPTANKKLKLETGSRHKPAPKHTPKTTKIPFEVKPEDIIVVESDPEDSDIEILDQTPVRLQPTQEDERFEGFGEPSLLVDTPLQEDHEDFLGTPHLLCDGPDDTRLTASSSRGPTTACCSKTQVEEQAFPSGNVNAINTASVSLMVSPSPSISGSTTADVLEHEVACPICGQDLSTLSSPVSNHLSSHSRS